MAKPLHALEISAKAQQRPEWLLVSRVLASEAFRTSQRLREFLLYVCDCALRDAPEEATEQHIGMQVFGRAAGFNSGEDSIVRTQARALRQKLAEYFREEGVGEPRILVIPKGHYLPVFQARETMPTRGQAPAAIAGMAAVALPVLPALLPPAAATLTRRPARLVAASVLATTVAAAALWLGLWLVAQPSLLDRFWAPFFTGNNALVIYSNALFVGSAATGMHYAPPEGQVHSPLPNNYVDTYTGIGELNSVYDLTRLFDQHHATFTLKRSRLVTWDEAQSKNLIFLGSVAENSSVQVLPSNMDFTLMAADGMAGIVNHNPQPGEQALYARREHPLTRDYAILALLPGLSSGRRIAIFSGLMTTGTQAAVEFACRRDAMDDLLRRVGQRNGQVRPFQAVLETTLAGGVPIETHVAALHVH